MENIKMSLFNAPIAPQRNAIGQFLKNASLTPVAEVSLEQVFKLITEDEQLKELTCRVRSAKDMRAAKASLLPYVTPCGVFTKRKADGLVMPAGLVVIDIDHLPCADDAKRLKERLFGDAFLRPALVFVSPSGLGVKAFVPYSILRNPNTFKNISENTRWAMNYVRMAYGDLPGGASVDASGKDVARACFLCHDGEAMIR